MVAYALFWGCQIPARLPFAEKATRVLLHRLKIPAQDLTGFTCCPEKELIRTTDEELWYTAGARNLALAETSGLDVLTPCNGCYSTQKEILYQLKLNPRLKEKVNQALHALNLNYQGRVKTKHLVEFLYDDYGTVALQGQVTAPLAGVKVAVHYGCHLLRPNPAINFDDPVEPTKFDALVQALGAKSVSYSTKMLCCGQGFNAVEEAEKSAALPALKLRELKELGVKALVTSCPTCFMQYDYKQAIMRRQGEDIHIPVFYVSELIALALGAAPQELGLELHRTSTEPFVEEWQRQKERLIFARKHFDLTLVEKCYRCGGCVPDCPSAKVDPSWNPNHIMGRILDGEVEELIASPEAWQCIDCYVCDEMCPQRWSMRRAFETLRQLALKGGHAPRGARNAFDAFAKTGRLIEATESAQAQRARLGLPPAPKLAPEVIQGVLDAAKNHDKPVRQKPLQ
ncbi:MAG: 4Fe-4S dicluster domain-containing protein [Chloroflexi bacterium]|nr:4Fe-4S dicluster domain-containing protein [Chloroflexota bacterium]